MNALGIVNLNLMGQQEWLFGISYIVLITIVRSVRRQERMKPENILKPLTPKCKEGKCKHKKCSCGHCSQYHFARTDECCKINLNLTTCLCRQFKEAREHETSR